MTESDKTSRPTPLSTAYASAARSIGRRLRYMRGQLGISQQELGKNIGIHRSYVSRLERGTILPRFSTLVRLAMYLKIDVGKLVSGCNGSNPPP
jgi:transcriptional regulator with XRE-family HTH domain